MHTALPSGVERLACRGVNAYSVDPANGSGSSTAAEAAAGERPGLDGDAALTLVDAGTPWDAATIRTGVERAGHELSDIERVLLTHYDLDHVGALADLARHGLSASVHAAEPDASHLTGQRSPALSSVKGVSQRLAGLLVDRPALRVERVTDGGTIGGFDAYRTPGHTPGHVAYVHEGLSAAFVGDLAREREGRLAAPQWYLNADGDALVESIQSFADDAPAFEALCPGHGEPISENGSVVLARLGAEAARRR